MAHNNFKIMVAYLYIIYVLSNISFALDSCCSELQLALGNAVSFPADQTYHVAAQSYWSQQEQNLAPSCIISPKDTQEVSTAIRILSNFSTSTDTDNSSCPFAIKGAGHTPWAGSANVHDGVTIDLGAMKSVVVNHPENAVTSIGPGARWSDVYQVLDRISLTVAGGRVANVGVGGLITGGRC